MARHRRSAGETTRARIIAAYAAAPQLPPTYQEIADALGEHVNNVKYHVDVLVEEGILIRTPRKARGISLAAPLPSGGAVRPEDNSTDAAILSLIRRRMTLGELCPTIGELAASLALSKSTIRRHVRALLDAGRIRQRDVLREVLRREYCMDPEASGE